MNRTALRASALVLTAALGLTACASDPLRAGAAAVVGDQRITTSELADLTDAALEDPAARQRFTATPQARQDFERQELARLVNHRLLLALAAREGVTLTGGAIDAQLASLAEQTGGAEALAERAAQNGLPPAELRSFAGDLALQDLLGDALTRNAEVSQEDLQAAYDANIAEYDQVRAAHIVVEDKVQSDKILAAVQADPTQFAPLAKEFSTDTNNRDDGGDLGFAGRGSFVGPFEDAIFAAKVGDVVQVQTQFGWHVVRVVDRRTTTLAQATPELRRAALEGRRRELVTAGLVSIASEVGVKVSPRYGRYVAAEGVIAPIDRPAISPAPVLGEVPAAPTAP